MAKLTLLSWPSDVASRSLLCDVFLRAGDVEVAAHKNVLAASSPYFLAMFTGGMTEKTATVVEIGHVDGAALCALVDFIYTSGGFFLFYLLLLQTKCINLKSVDSDATNSCFFL